MKSLIKKTKKTQSPLYSAKTHDLTVCKKHRRTIEADEQRADKMSRWRSEHYRSSDPCQLNLNKMVGLKAGGGGGYSLQFYVPRLYKERRVDLMFSQKGQQLMLSTAAQSWAHFTSEPSKIKHFPLLTNLFRAPLFAAVLTKPDADCFGREMRRIILFN